MRYYYHYKLYVRNTCHVTMNSVVDYFNFEHLNFQYSFVTLFSAWFYIKMKVNESRNKKTGVSNYGPRPMSDF